jgi:hypothetical protein
MRSITHASASAASSAAAGPACCVRCSPATASCTSICSGTVRWAARVVRLVFNGGALARLSEPAIAAIRQRELNGLVELARRRPLQRRDKVRVRRGPFEGHFGNPRRARDPAAGRYRRGDVMRLPDADVSFFWAAVTQLDPESGALSVSASDHGRPRSRGGLRCAAFWGGTTHARASVVTFLS